MNVSSEVVRLAPDDVADGVRRLEELPGVEVRFTDTARGRIVVTQETLTTNEQDAGMRRIQALPRLLSAELVCHYFGEREERHLTMRIAVRSRVVPALAALAVPNCGRRAPRVLLDLFTF